MEMVELNHDGGSLEHASTDPEQFLFPDSLGLGNDYGTPGVLARVGEQYQASIPEIMTEKDYLQTRQSWIDIEHRDDIDDFLCMRLTVPLVWVSGKTNSVKHETFTHVAMMESLYYEDTGECKGDVKSAILGQFVGSNNPHRLTYLKACSSCSMLNFLYGRLKVKTGSLDNTTCGCKEQNPSSHGPQPLQMKSNSFIPCQQNSFLGQISESRNQNQSLDLQRKGKGFVDFESWHLVPGVLGESWNELECEAFLLGLYIFGKNLIQVKKIVETKNMGDILFFYYGKFFKSDAYRRWSECQKIRSKRCIHGHRLFHGLRQQELLSRLIPLIPEESKNILLESTEAYNEGKISLEEYVTTLKMTAGLATLVEAVGIGKGNRDLSGMMAEPAKAIQRARLHSEIPTGKACSSLTSEEIIKFLTGDFRLSKARSSDLFWEAVWPRLLARGWHSEQPEVYGFVGSKNSLVFLIPGIKKFSRRRLVKGTHYFDSVSDVLNRVALDPNLLKIETDEVKSIGVKEDAWDSDSKLDERGLSRQGHHHYLQPRLSSYNSEHIKFTIVDTSTDYEDPRKVREMRTLPMDTDCQASISTGSNDNVCEEEAEVPDSRAIFLTCLRSFTNSSSDHLEKSLNRRLQSEHPKGQSSTFKQLLAKDELHVAGGSICVQEREHVASKAKKRSHESNLIVASCAKKYLSPVLKHRRIGRSGLGDNNQEDDALATRLNKKEGEIHSHSKLFKDSLLGSPAFNHSQEPLISTTSIGGKCETMGGDDLGCSNPKEKGLSLWLDKSSPQTLIDLNLPHCPSDYEMDEAFDTREVNCHDNAELSGDSFTWATNAQGKSTIAFEPSDGISSTKESMMQARRQSTRSRPLTTRALEALACGLLIPSRRVRGTKS